MFSCEILHQKWESPCWALTLTETVPEAFEFLSADWPEKSFSNDQAQPSDSGVRI